MGLLGAVFGKKAKLATQEIKKFEKRDLMEATVGIAVLVMWADGDAEDTERTKIANVLANNPALSAFGPEVQSTFNRYDSLCKESGFMLAKVQILREIADVKGDPREMEDVLVTGLTIALSDGEMEEPEEKILRQVATSFGLRIEDYLG